MMLLHHLRCHWHRRRLGGRLPGLVDEIQVAVHPGYLVQCEGVCAGIICEWRKKNGLIEFFKVKQWYTIDFKAFIAHFYMNIVESFVIESQFGSHGFEISICNVLHTSITFAHITVVKEIRSPPA